MGGYLPRPSTTLYDSIAFATATGPHGVLLTMLGLDDKYNGVASLVSATDGNELWSGKLLRPGVVPLLAENASSWSPRNLDFWASVSRDIALGGDQNIFEQVTRVQENDLDIQSIESIRGQQPDKIQEQTRWQLIVSRVKTLLGVGQVTR